MGCPLWVFLKGNLILCSKCCAAEQLLSAQTVLVCWVPIEPLQWGKAMGSLVGIFMEEMSQWRMNSAETPGKGCVCVSGLQRVLLCYFFQQPRTLQVWVWIKSPLRGYGFVSLPKNSRSPYLWPLILAKESLVSDGSRVDSGYFVTDINLF